jgi:hypothetical protein
MRARATRGRAPALLAKWAEVGGWCHRRCLFRNANILKEMVDLGSKE